MFYNSELHPSPAVLVRLISALFLANIVGSMAPKRSRSDNEDDDLAKRYNTDRTNELGNQYIAGLEQRQFLSEHDVMQIYNLNCIKNGQST